MSKGSDIQELFHQPIFPNLQRCDEVKSQEEATVRVPGMAIYYQLLLKDELLLLPIW